MFLYAGGAHRDEPGREAGDRKGARKFGVELTRGIEPGALWSLILGEGVDGAVIAAAAL